MRGRRVGFVCVCVVIFLGLWRSLRRSVEDVQHAVWKMKQRGLKTRYLQNNLVNADDLGTTRTAFQCKSSFKGNLLTSCSRRTLCSISQSNLIREMVQVVQVYFVIINSEARRKLGFFFFYNSIAHTFKSHGPLCQPFVL